MTARWNRLPDKARVKKERAKPQRHGTWKCHTCGELLTKGYAAAERHADTHGSARLEFML